VKRSDRNALKKKEMIDNQAAVKEKFLALLEVQWKVG
jgi:hypothetical protein